MRRIQSLNVKIRWITMQMDIRIWLIEVVCLIRIMTSVVNLISVTIELIMTTMEQLIIQQTLAARVIQIMTKAIQKHSVRIILITMVMGLQIRVIQAVRLHRTTLKQMEHRNVRMEQTMTVMERLITQQTLVVRVHRILMRQIQSLSVRMLQITITMAYQTQPIQVVLQHKITLREMEHLSVRMGLIMIGMECRMLQILVVGQIRIIPRLMIKL